MSSYHLAITPLQPLRFEGLHWCLDFPQDQQAFELSEGGDALYLQGWLLSTSTPVKLSIRQRDHIQWHALDRKRADVIEHIFKQPGENHSQLKCGFKLSVPVLHDEIVLGVEVNNRSVDLVRISIQGVFKVLRGMDHWLFLDNDTNKSVEQFTGKLLLEPAKLQEWKRYFDGLLELQRKQPAAILIAPAKEMVYPEFYPYSRAELTPVDQVIQLDEAKATFIYPLTALQRSSKRSFRITDTHWSAFGAMIATKQVAKRFGISLAETKALFKNDKYRLYSSFGDLGKKVFPPQQAKERRLKNFSYRKWLCYDNGLSNFGRVMVLHYPTALHEGHLLLFGSSSSYSMFNYLVRVFRTVTFIHTAGNIDSSLVQLLQPDFVLSQTNGRFVVRPPSIDYCLQQVIAEKLLDLTAIERDAIAESASEQMSTTELTAVRLVHQLFEQGGAR